MKRRAFSLIELLVVVAIIALLAGVLLPALAKAKSTAHQITCLKAAKNWAVAMQMYNEDHEDAIPRENGGDNDVSEVVAAPRSLDVWYNNLPVYLGVPAARDHIRETNTLDTFYDRSSMFCCPSVKPIPELIRRSAPRFSRGMNARLMDTNKLQFTTRIAHPSKTVAFAEVGAPGEIHLDSQKVYTGRPHVKWDHTSVRHRGKGNVAFLDGSAHLFGPAVLTNKYTKVIHWTTDGENP